MTQSMKHSKRDLSFI